jgi:signal peptidase I
LVATEDKISASRLADYGRRKVWLAAALAIIFPGLGQLYNGQIITAVIILVVILASHCLIVIQNQNLPIILTLVNQAIYILAIVYAIITAHRLRGGYITKKINNWIFYMIFLMIGIILTSMPGQFLYGFHRVPEYGCMGERYSSGDILYINRYAYLLAEPAVDDIVLFRVPAGGGVNSLGRIWAWGEKEIVIRNNAVFLDGYEILSSRPPDEAVPQMQTEDTEMMARDTVRTVAIPEGSYLIIGDNSLGWADFSCCGIYSKSLIMGKVDYLFYDAPAGEEDRKVDLNELIYYLFLK